MVDQLEPRNPELEHKFDAIVEALEDEDFQELAEKANEHLEAVENPLSPPLLSLGDQQDKAIARFLGLFGIGYAKWQSGYSYPLVRSLFACAVSALENDGFDWTSTDETRAMLEFCRDWTRMTLNYTQWENSVVTNNVEAGREYARRCVEQERTMAGSLKRIKHRSLSKTLPRYLEANRQLHEGLVCTTLALLAEETAKADRHLKDAADRMDQLRKLSYELYSELRAHYLIASERVSQGLVVPSLSIKAEVGWFVCTPVHITLARMFYDVCKSDEAKSILTHHFGQESENQWKPVSLYLPVIPDIFETSFGEEESKVVEVRFSDARLASQGAPYSIHVSLKVGRMGICSVHMFTEVEGASVSGVRALQSAITPQAGNFPTSWTELEGLGAAVSSSLEPTDPPLYPWEDFDLLKEFNRKHEGVIQGFPLKEELLELTSRAQKEILDVSVSLLHCKDDPEREKKLGGEEGDLANKLDPFRDLLLPILEHLSGWAAEAMVGMDFVADLNTIALLMHRIRNEYYNLEDLAERITKRFEDVLKSIAKEVEDGTLSLKDENLRRELVDLDEEYKKLPYDNIPHWYTYLYCKSLHLTRDGLPEDLKSDIKDIRKIPANCKDLNGILVGQREPASFDDWYFVPLPELEDANLGTIRSHGGDLLYMTENTAAMYFPDDPQYLVDQYRQTVEMVFWMRSLVLSADEEIRQKLGELFGLRPQNEHSLLVKLRAETLEHMRVITSAKMAQYQDHSTLMRRMLQQVGVDRIQSYLQQRLDDMSALENEINARDLHKSQNTLSSAFIAFAFISAGLAVFSLFPELVIQLKPLGVSYAIFALGSVPFFVVRWILNRHL